MLKITLALLSIALALSAFANSKDKALLYRLKKQYAKNMPNDFIASIQSTAISKSLKKIPKTAYCVEDSNEIDNKIRVSYVFLKEAREESIIVEDVQSPYTSRFQGYFEIYRQSKWFLDIDRDLEEINYILHFEIVDENRKYYIVKTRKKRLSKTNYLILHIKKKDLTITKAIQYSDNKELGSLSLSYKKIKGYVLPYIFSFSIKNKDKKRDFKLTVTDYNVNVGLTIDLVIALQDDCPTLKLFY